MVHQVPYHLWGGGEIDKAINKGLSKISLEDIKNKYPNVDLSINENDKGKFKSFI